MRTSKIYQFIFSTKSCLLTHFRDMCTNYFADCAADGLLWYEKLLQSYARSVLLLQEVRQVQELCLCFVKLTHQFLQQTNLRTFSQFRDCIRPPSWKLWIHCIRNRPPGAHNYFCFNLSLITESYLEYQYTPVKSLFSAQLITVPVYTAFTSITRRTKAQLRTLSKKPDSKFVWFLHFFCFLFHLPNCNWIVVKKLLQLVTVHTMLRHFNRSQFQLITFPTYSSFVRKKTWLIDSNSTDLLYNKVGHSKF